MIHAIFNKRARLGRQLMDEVGGSLSSPAQLEKVRRLLDLGAVVNYNDGSESILSRAGRSPWCGADVVQLLLECGANVDGTQRPGLVPPLVRAAHRSDSERLRLLVDAGADLNAVDGTGRSVLTELTPWAEPEIIEYLLARGADPNVSGLRGFKPLHFVAISGRADLADLYVRYGADLSARDTSGFTPVQLALNQVALDQEAMKRCKWLSATPRDAVIERLRALEG